MRTPAQGPRGRILTAARMTSRRARPVNLGKLIAVPTLAQLFDLTGRVAIVTGGSRGLGLEMAEGLAEAGAVLMLCARRDEWLLPAVAALRARGFTVDGVRCDVSNAADVQAVVDRTLAVYG